MAKPKAPPGSAHFLPPEPEPAPLSIGDVNAMVTSIAMKQGCDPQTASELILHFHRQLEAGELFSSGKLLPMERLFLQYVDHVFTRIARDGKSAAVALGLKQGRGEYVRSIRGASEDNIKGARDVEVTAYVLLLRRNGWTWKVASGMAANEFFSDSEGEKAVEAAYRDMAPILKTLPTEALERRVQARLKPVPKVRRVRKPKKS